MKQIVGIGHSHLPAVSAALSEFSSQNPGRISYTQINLRNAQYVPALTKEGGLWKANPNWLKDMRESIIGPDVTVFLYLYGNEHFRWSLTPGPRPFDFVDPLKDDGLPLIGELVPYDLIMRHIRSAFDSIKEYVAAVRSVAQVELMQFLPPPPVFDLESLELPKEAPIVKLADEHGISPAPFRLKMWRACARAMRERCETIGVECAFPPAEAVDVNGYLRQEMVHDFVHGNLAWGRLLSQHVLAVASRQGPQQ